MLHKLRTRAAEEKGFTLIELLVVILIIGILAAIALPVFLGQQQKGQDAAAKSDVRNAYSHVEACFADSPAQSYQDCNEPTANELGTATDTGVTFITSGTPAAGQVLVSSSNATSFAVTAASRTGTTFTITKTNGAAPARSCAGTSKGCRGSSW